jgi:hypothetical protein
MSKNKIMNKDRFNQIIDEVYEKYTIKYMGHEDVPSKDLFLFEIKTNKEFSKKWGLKIEERELSFEERWDLSEKYGYRKKVGEMPIETETFNGVNEREEFNSMMNDPVMGINLPTKLITLTYSNETIESYE